MGKTALTGKKYAHRFKIYYFLTGRSILERQMLGLAGISNTFRNARSVSLAKCNYFFYFLFNTLMKFKVFTQNLISRKGFILLLLSEDHVTDSVFVKRKSLLSSQANFFSRKKNIFKMFSANFNFVIGT